MDILLILGGSALVCLVFVDVLMTTLVVSAGAGPLTSRLAGYAWRLLLRVHRPDSESSVLGGTAGSAILISTVLAWVGGLWVGWTTVFLASGAVTVSADGQPASATDVAYFTGTCLFTLGTGDVVASTPGWRLVATACSFSGLFLITLSITYLVSVVAAVVARRSLAIQIHALGESVHEIVVRGWREGFDGVFQQQLVTLTAQVAGTAEQHLAYPVLHYFHAKSRRLAAPVAIASLDEALTVLQHAVRPGSRPSLTATQPLRYAIERYLNTAVGGAWAPDVAVPPPPTRRPFVEAGVPVYDDHRFDSVFHDEAERRVLLHRLVASDGWSWPT